MTTTNDEPNRRPEVSAGMAAARERGVRLGRPPAPAPVGATRAEELRDAGNSLTAIAAALNAEQVSTPSGKGAWTRSSVQYALAQLAKQREQEQAAGD
jgi:DNA invertase Pin-like site-specific DNA recombinase